MSEAGQELILRIVVVDPPQGVAFAVQRGREELEAAQVARGSKLRFDVQVQVRGNLGAVDFRGPAVQGRRGDRFVYLNSGTFAGQPDSCWSRRAKLKLGSITPQLVERARESSAVLEARIAGKAKDGGPACATVLLLDAGWHTASQMAGEPA